MTQKKTVILGATANTSRYAFIAANMLEEYGMQYIPVGIKTGQVNGKEILYLRDKPQISDVHTVTLYIGARNLPEWHDYILSLKPKRIIFNPGTEDQDLMNKAKSDGVETVFGCTLVMLRSDQF